MRKLTAVTALLTISLYCFLPAAQPDGHHGAYGPDRHQGRAPRGFESPRSQTVKQILGFAHDDELVLLTGRLTRYLGDEKYELTDSDSDSIVVVLDDDRDWSYIAKNQLIEVAARVDKDLMFTKLEVKDARPVTPPE